MNYNNVATVESITRTVTNLASHNIEASVVESKADALAKINELIPAGSSIMNGSSLTLEQIGFIEQLKSDAHGWHNLHAAIVAESDPKKQGELRAAAVHADYYLGSIHALSESGEFVIASATGSQLPNIVFTSKNLIFVVGSQKIVPTLSDALKRLEEHVIPLENVQSNKKWGVDTADNKIVIFKGESKMMGRSVRVIIVKESLGF